MKRLHVLLFVLTGFLFIQCNKPVYKYNPDFEGIWRTIPVYDSVLNYSTISEIVINGEDGSFKSTCTPCGSEVCNCTFTQTGKAVLNDSKTQMRMGSNGAALTINKEPHVDNSGSWTMTINELDYFKK